MNTQPAAAKEGADSGDIPCSQAQRPIVYRRKKIGAKERPALFSDRLARDACLWILGGIEDIRADLHVPLYAWLFAQG